MRHLAPGRNLDARHENLAAVSRGLVVRMPKLGLDAIFDSSK